MKLALVGATGLVGKEMIEVLEEQNIPFDTFIPVASARSVGKKITINNKEYEVKSMDDAIAMKPDFALFSAGGGTSLQHAPRFQEVGTTVIDNSSAWRMNPDVKLVVPEVNGDLLTSEDKIIANPNCSTIQLVVALNPIHQKYGIKRLVISTYQSYTGTGAQAVKQYDAESAGNPLSSDDMAYHYPIYENCIPHCDIFLDNDYTKEEMKLVHETRKILQAPDVKITATAVRVPVHGGHSESVNIELEKPYEIEDMKDLLANSTGLTVQDNPQTNEYPMPKFAHKKDGVFVGRIRRDDSVDNGLNIWVVADNLRKGAATNAVQILQHLTR